MEQTQLLQLVPVRSTNNLYSNKKYKIPILFISKIN